METTQPETQVQPEPTTEQPTNWKRLVLDILETVVLAVVLYFGINAVSARVRVDGFSMNPTLQNGEYILVIIGTRQASTQRGDIVVFMFPMKLEEDLIKRVIVSPVNRYCEGAYVTLMDMPINEPYINAAPFYNGEWQVPKVNVLCWG